MLNPIFIQLFGRDVIDRLEEAGIESDDAVAGLGAEKLSSQAGIEPEVARRVVALAVELCASSRPARARRGGASRSRSRKAGARKKRPADETTAPADPIAPSERAAAPAGLADIASPFDPADPAADDEIPEMPALQESQGDFDAFVDEAGLIAWMGFASRIGPEGSLRSSVAEGILEPAAHPESDQPQFAADPSPLESTARPATRSPAGHGVITLEGSFWEFGSRPHGGVTISPDSTVDPDPEGARDDSAGSRSNSLRPVPFYRRRSHDGH